MVDDGRIPTFAHRQHHQLMDRNFAPGSCQLPSEFSDRSAWQADSSHLSFKVPLNAARSCMPEGQRAVMGVNRP
jgi:hypothetical protein